MTRLLIGIVVGVLLMGVAFWGIPVADVLAALTRVRVGGLLGFSALLALQMVLQALRQQVLLAGLAPQLRPPPCLCSACLPRRLRSGSRPSTAS